MQGPQIRINTRIRVPEVRLVDHNGEMIGVVSTSEALARAEKAGLDLVEVNPKTAPPVCKILDYGKFKYEEKKRQREAKRKQTVVEVKEIKLRPKTDDHDIDVKVRASRRFLEAGNKVKLTVRFRGREIMHPQIAQAQLDTIFSRCEDLANIELRPSMEGRQMFLIMAPKPQVLQRVQQIKARKEKEKDLRSQPSNPESDLDDADLDDADDGDEEYSDIEHAPPEDSTADASPAPSKKAPAAKGRKTPKAAKTAKA